MAKTKAKQLPKRKRNWNKKTMTRDIAVSALSTIQTHQIECLEFRKRLMRHMTARDKAQDRMHKENHTKIDNGLGEVRQALQVSGSERRRSFEQLQEQIDGLASAIGVTDDRISEAEKENIERDLSNERASWTKWEKVYWAVGAAMFALLMFLLKEKFFP